VTINITGIGDSNATQIIENELSISTKQIEQDKEQDDDEDNITDLAPK